MPTLDWNAQVWDGSYDWSRAGEEWSGAWGSSAAQWYGTVLPRIYRWLPKEGTILEIAPGFGRWTNFLRHHCASLIGVDMAGKCVEACRVRFAGDPRTVFHQNDGQSLSMVPDGTIDFCFSFDSLVHAPIEAVSSYIVQLSTKLSPHGVAILHHSNSAEYVNHPDAQAHSRDKKHVGRIGCVGCACREPRHHLPGVPALGWRRLLLGLHHYFHAPGLSLRQRPASRTVHDASP